MKHVFFTLLVTLMIFSIVYSQSEYASVMISAIGSIPNGDMATKLGKSAHQTRRYGFEVGENIGMASSGFGLGLELNTPVLLEGLGWIVSFRFIENMTDPSEAESKFESAFDDTVNFSYETGNWLNFPVMSGFRYKISLTDKIALTALIQAGFNFSRAPYRQAKVDSVVAEKVTYNFTRDFGYEVGFSVEFFGRWNLEFTYLNLNTPRYAGTQQLSEKIFPKIYSREIEIIGDSRASSMYLISLGYYIFR